MKKREKHTKRGTNDATHLKTASAWKEVRTAFRTKEREAVGAASPVCNFLDQLLELGCVDFAKALGDWGEGRAIDERVAVEVPLPRDIKPEENCFRGPMMGLKDRPGFLHCPNALGDSLVETLTFMCLERYCKKPHKTNIDSHMHRPEPKRPKLAWASLGFNFDWTKRKYFNEARTPFPTELEELTAFFARATQAHANGYVAQTAIVNYYGSGGNMGAHVDDSEDDKVNPVVSLNLGCSCVFLVGKSDREEAPVPVLVRSGDVVILSGESRLCYHGVAHVFSHQVPLPDNFPIEYMEPLQVDRLAIEESVDLDEHHREEIAEYLASRRLNLNVRQVLKDGATELENSS